MIREDDRPIGIFDSGIGGLTVLSAIQQVLPGESTLYLGDTARVPYGTKSPEVVTRYALNNARFLTRRDIKLLVVACNTASAVALEALEEQLEVPVVGVIRPGARRAAEVSQSGVIGVIGTEGTIASGAYRRALLELNPQLTVDGRPCPLFVPLAEEGWEKHSVTEQVARVYLGDWAVQPMDTLILGCTHYPVLTASIQKVIGGSVNLVDSASATARTVAERLEVVGSAGSSGVRHEFFVTDVPERFRAVGQRFLRAPLGQVFQVDIDTGG